MRILVTGATGFIGRHLCASLLELGYEVRAPVRPGNTRAAAIPQGVQQVPCRDLQSMCAADDWFACLEDIDRVVHLAGLAHLVNRTEAASAEFHAINAEATRALSRAAARCGVARLVFVSTAKIFGEESRVRPFDAADPPLPTDTYARSKLEAERGLLAETAQSRCEAVVVRPPLVYGPGVKGNFARLVNLVRSGIPLPLGAVRNRRSIVSVWNLCSLLERALGHPQAAGRILLPTDSSAVSTPELLRMIAAAMSVKTRLIPVPLGLLNVVATSLGRTEDLSRLLGSLEIDGSGTRRLLQWEPPMATEHGLRLTVRDPMRNRPAK